MCITPQEMKKTRSIIYRKINEDSLGSCKSLVQAADLFGETKKRDTAFSNFSKFKACYDAKVPVRLSKPESKIY